MNNMIKKLSAILLLLGMSVANVQAIPSGISGEISFGGTLTTDSGDLVNASTLFFGGGAVSTPTGSSGDYLADGIVSGDAVTISTLAFGSFVSPALFWTIAGSETNSGSDYTFTIETLTIDVQVLVNGVEFLALSGTGLASCSTCGLADQDGTWTLSADTVGGTLLSFSSTASVPEPAILGLMGLGLLGLAGVRRRKS